MQRKSDFLTSDISFSFYFFFFPPTTNRWSTPVSPFARHIPLRHSVHVTVAALLLIIAVPFQLSSPHRTFICETRLAVPSLYMYLTPSHSKRLLQHTARQNPSSTTPTIYVSSSSPTGTLIAFYIIYIRLNITNISRNKKKEDFGVSW